MIGIRRLAKSVTRKCARCQRHDSRDCRQPVAPLSELRVKSDSIRLSDCKLAIRRFTACRGHPSVLYSDNAKTFVASVDELQKVYSHLSVSSLEIHSYTFSLMGRLVGTLEEVCEGCC